MNYFPFHIGDYAAHTAHLEPMEDLAYRRMLDLYYIRECALPDDVEEIARLIRLRKNVAEVRAVLREFFTNSEGEGYIHMRCEEEIRRMQDKQAKARESAKASHSARRANAERTHSERKADAEPTHSEGFATNTNTNTNNSPSESRARKRAAASPPPVSADVLVAGGFDVQTAAEFIAHKQREKAPLTERAWRDHCREAAKAGWTPQQAAEKVMAKGWKGFEAKYVAGDAHPVSFAERATAVKAARLAEMTGGLLGSPAVPQGGEVIELEATNGAVGRLA